MPNRVLRETICTSETVDQLSWFEEVLFYRLIVNCDDFGRFDGRPAIVKSRLFPLKDNLTNASVEKALQGLANAGLVALYVFEGKRLLCLPTWGKYQQIRARESKYPAPPTSAERRKTLIANDIICNQASADADNCAQMSPYSRCEIRGYEDTRNRGCDIREAGAGAGSDAPAREEPPTPPTKSNAVAYFLSHINANASGECLRELLDYESKLGAEATICALTAAQDEQKTGWKYIRAILESYLADGVTCAADVHRRESLRQKNRGPQPKRAARNADYQRHDSPMSDLERRAVERALIEGAEPPENEEGN